MQSHSKGLQEGKPTWEKVLGSNPEDFGKSSRTDLAPVEILKIPGRAQIPKQLGICRSQDRSKSGTQVNPPSKLE